MLEIYALKIKKRQRDDINTDSIVRTYFVSNIHWTSPEKNKQYSTQKCNRWRSQHTGMGNVTAFIISWTARNIFFLVATLKEND